MKDRARPNSGTLKALKFTLSLPEFSSCNIKVTNQSYERLNILAQQSLKVIVHLKMTKKLIPRKGMILPPTSGCLLGQVADSAAALSDN